MASVYPAMKGKFGSTEYFMLRMKAGDVANQLVIPKEMRGWKALDLEERFQRQINYNRVNKQIAPYLSKDPDRFFGALIVSVFNHEGMEFESASDMLRGIHKLYRNAAESFGFLILSGGEILVPLDGQHRLAALQAAISGKDEKQQEIPKVVPNRELANDDVMLIMIRDDPQQDPQKGRRIFNKVNRYAKATSASENLITADDDVTAVISREIANELIGSALVNYQSNTLSNTTHYFTTLSTIHKATKAVLEGRFGKINTSTLPEEAKITSYKGTAKEYWEKLLGIVKNYHSAILTEGTEGNKQRVKMRRVSLLGKPVSQLALMLAIIRLTNKVDGDGSKLSWDTIVERINAADWANDNPMWQNILMNGSKIVSNDRVPFASRFIAYYLGEFLTEPELDKLRDDYISHFADHERSKAKFPGRLFGPRQSRNSS